MRFGRNFRNFKNNEFQEYLSKIDWEVNFHNKNTDHCIDFLIKNIERLLDEMAPMKRLSNRDIGLKQRPWICHDILDIMRDRDKFNKKYAREINPGRKEVIFRIYKSKRNHVVQLIRSSKRKYYAEYFENKIKTIQRRFGRESVI